MVKFMENDVTYEELEQTLGCPINVVFQAVVFGIWYEDVRNHMVNIGVVLTAQNYDCDLLLQNYYDTTLRFLLSNYKKTWWLKRNKEE